MLKKCYIALVLIFTFFSLLPIKAAAAINLPAGIPENIKVDGITYGVNENIATDKGYLVYGTAADVPENDYKNSAGTKVTASTKGAIPRYLGYDVNGNKYSNFDFPVDADSGREPWEKDWIKYPWGAQMICDRSEFNNDPNAAAWLDKLKWSGWNGEKLKDYLLIQSPPTEYAPGTCVGWHTYLDKVWYQVFSIEPFKKLVIKKTETKPEPTVITKGNYYIDGCFLDIPKVHNGKMVTWVIRAPRTFDNKLYPIDQPIQSRITVWLVNTKHLNATLPASLKDNGTIIFDSNITFTKAKPYWVKKITFDIPKVKYQTGIIVKCSDDKGDGVTCSVWNTGDPVYGLAGESHTTALSPTKSDWLNYIPWDDIKAEYDISR